MEKIERISEKELTVATTTFKLAMIRRNYENVDLDGDICTLDKYYEFLKIDVYKDGKLQAWSAYRPWIITEDQHNRKGMGAPAGAYAQLTNHCYLSESTYKSLNKIIDEMFAETGTAEILEAKKNAEEKQAKKEKAEAERDAQYDRLIA